MAVNDHDANFYAAHEAADFYEFLQDKLGIEYWAALNKEFDELQNSIHPISLTTPSF